MNKKYRELSVSELNYSITREEASYIKPTEDPLKIIGQPRALNALRLGTEIRANGYNIFISGLPGTGRYTAIRKVIEEYKPAENHLKDITCVYNFKKPENPRILYFKPGYAVKFKKEIHNLIEKLKTIVKARLESDSYKNRRDRIISMREQAENRLLSEFSEKLSEDNFQIVSITRGETEVADITPMYKGEPVDFGELQAMVASGEMNEEEWRRLREKYYHYIDEMRKLFLELRKEREATEEELKILKKETLKPDVHLEIEQLKAIFDNRKIHEYLDSLEDDIIESIYLFTQESKDNEKGASRYVKYGVNILVDNSDKSAVPVIFENHPTYRNLFGTIESKVGISGEVYSDFMQIKAGSMIMSSGGFLIINVEDLLQERDSWYSLKRTLKTGMVEIQPSPGAYIFPVSALKPEPVEVDAKVILVGGENMFDLLYHGDPDVSKLFKVPAEFESEMPRNPEGIGRYASFIQKLVGDEGLNPLTVDGICTVIEYGIRLAEDKKKLSTKFSLIADIIREANYWAQKAKKKMIERESVLVAIREKNYLFNLAEEKFDQYVTENKLLVRLKGKEVGRVNGLAVQSRGYYSFGKPLIISACISPGEAGVINIEREAGLSGGLHDKGVFILEGHLRNKYAHSFPLSISASICFEQSYWEVDGDSASSAEVFALLSALAQVPLRQDLAVTGSINQMGEIQPVGGITEKVEGFYRICSKIELTGTQGVIIPEQNVVNLILSEEVMEIIREGKFHIYPIRTVDEGMELLTGMEAGKRASDGTFPPGTVNYLIEKTLEQMANSVKNYG